MTGAAEHARVAVVTGAGSADGIGHAAAAALLDAGCAVVVTATGAHVRDRVDELRARAGVDDAMVLGHVADLTHPSAAAGLVEAAVSRFGRLDVVVNNAGMALQGDLDPDVSVGEMSDAQWAAVLRRNLDTCFHVTRAAIGAPGALRVRPGGERRVDDGTDLGDAGAVGLRRGQGRHGRLHTGARTGAGAARWHRQRGRPGMDRHGVRHRRRSCATVPRRRWGVPAHPTRSARSIAFLASPAASYVTGQCVVVDGGNSVLEARSG